MNNKKRINLIILQIVLAILSLVIIIPLFMILINAVKTEPEAAMLSLGLPNEFQFNNFKVVFTEGSVLTGYINSMIIGAAAVFVIMVSGALAAFVIQRRDSALTNKIYYLFIIGLVIPVALVPTIKMMVNLKLHNTYLGMILYYSAILLPFTIFLFTGYLKTVPRELDESAYIDGAGFLKLFFSIIFPIIRPAIVTASLIIIINIWNDFMGPFYLLSDSSKWTVTVSVYNYVGKYGTKWNLVFADVAVVITPILLLYFILQKHIVDGMTAGAIKG
ncbi:MAG: carbohydrate transporter permease [Eubacterium sp.]|jgi:raffinose/stachyose/melibiose transport system permease protein|nr:carbohydrate transporter permease [Eubacterium sp.]